MQREVQPPRITIARPQSASARRPNAPGRGASGYGRLVYAPTASSGSRDTSVYLRPSRPLSSAGKRPSSAIGLRRPSEIGVAIASQGALRISWEDRSISAHGIGVGVNILPRRPPSPEPSPTESTSNMYRLMVTRKDAEEAAKQLARRIAHFRSQEERVLRDMQSMRGQLELTLAEPQEKLKRPPDPMPDQMRIGLSAPCTPLRLHSRSTTFVRPETHREAKLAPLTTKAETKRKPKAPRSREQLQFLTKQKRLLQARKHEEARQQKEKLKAALAAQKAKEAKQRQQKRSQKERIRMEEQQALEQRSTKQQQQREATEAQQRERLQAERQRQQDALRLIHEMQEEERHLRLRLEALRFHQEHIKQNLQDTSPHRKA